MTDWQAIREQFPVTEHTAYLNSAAAGPLARQTTAAAIAYYQQMMADGDVHWDQWLAQREIVRRKVAAFINAEPEEIGLTTNTSAGMNLIVDALAGRGDVISCELEFPVTTITWMHRHIPINFIKTPSGELPVENVRAAMTERTGVIALSHVQYSNGFRLALEEMGNQKGRHAFVVNASQSAGAFAIDVKQMKIDALCATGHKWMTSGYGSGFVYLSKELLATTTPRAVGWLSVNDPYHDRNDELNVRGDAAARAELGCPHFAGMFALGAAIDQLADIGVQRIEERVLSLNRLMTERVSAAGWRLLSPLRDEQFRSGETLVAADNPAELVAHLASRKVAVTEKPEGIRVATHFFNNEDDIERLIEGLQSYAGR
jgi:cysteine desulfurase / selenocysteine lyase